MISARIRSQRALADDETTSSARWAVAEFAKRVIVAGGETCRKRRRKESC